MTVNAKPVFEDLRLDAGTLPWQSSGTGDGAVEVAMVEALGQPWVLVRVAGDPDQRVLVYDHFEWECFIDGVRRGEFDDGDPAQR